VVAEPLCAQSDSSFPSGMVLRGAVKSVHRVGLGVIHETARIELEFRDAQFANGATQPIAARLVSVDNARERVDAHGVIHGIRATATLSNRVGERLALALVSHPMGLIPLFALESALLRFPDPEIDYPPGTELNLRLERPAELPDTRGCVPLVPAPEQSPKLRAIVDRLPYWTYTLRQHKAMDPTNLMFVGSAEEIDRAFHAAGWTGSRALSPAAALGVMRAIAEEHADANAPMRTLLLNGGEADMDRQKALNTFSKRHHIRFWKLPEQLDGAAVWASTATWDVNTTFSLRYGFTHQVQNDTDLERDKVVRDLAFAGCVDEVAYVPRGLAETDSGRSHDFLTDGRVAVVLLNSCNALPEDAQTARQFRQPSPLVRCIRRVTLTVRNHFLRDNLAWRSGEAVYLVYRGARDWRRRWMVSRMKPAVRALHARATSPGSGSELNGALGLLLGL